MIAASWNQTGAPVSKANTGGGPSRSIIALMAVVSVMQVNCEAAPGAWRTGIVAGAHFLLQVPTLWNRSLIVAAGGYSPSPLTFDAAKKLVECRARSQ